MARFTAVHTEFVFGAMILFGLRQRAAGLTWGIVVTGRRGFGIGIGRRRRGKFFGGSIIRMTLLFPGAFARIGFSFLLFGVLIRELVESDGLIDQSKEGESAAGHSTSLLNLVLETTEEHETFCIVVEIKRRSIGLQLLRIRSSRTSLPNAEELIFRLSFESVVTVDVGELLFEEVVIVTKRMRRIDGNFVRPGERFIL